MYVCSDHREKERERESRAIRTTDDDGRRPRRSIDSTEELAAAYAAAPFEDALVRVRGSLLARRRVDAVAVDVALLPGGHVPHLLARRRGVDQGGSRARLQPARQGLVGDEAVVLPVLEHAGHVGAVVGQAVADLE